MLSNRMEKLYASNDVQMTIVAANSQPHLLPKSLAIRQSAIP